MDKVEVTAVPLFDLSAAFDTIEHAIVTDIYFQIGMEYLRRGDSQIWFSSYSSRGVEEP